MKRALGIVLAFLNALAVLAVAGTAVPGAEAPGWTNVPPGGRGAGVTAMAIDAQGRMWAGTTNGMFSYDGYNFYPSRLTGTPPAVHVHALLAADSLLYAGAADGLYIINTITGHSRRPAASFPAEVRALLLDGTTLWIGSLNGLYAYDTSDGRLTRCDAPLPHNAVYALLKQPDTGNMYVGTFNGLAVMERSRPGSVRPVPVGPAPGGAPNTFVNALAYDPSARRLWVGMEGALRSLDAAGTVTILALNGHSVKTIALAPDGSILAGTDDGLAAVKADGTTSFYIHDLHNPLSIADNSVWSLMTDARGNIWAGTYAGFSIMPTAAPTLTTVSFDRFTGGDTNGIRRIVRDSRGNLWLGGNNGLIELDRAMNPVAWYKNSTSPHPISHPQVRDISSGPDGTLWIATDGGLLHLDSSTGRLVGHRITDATGSHTANWVYGVVDDGRYVWTGSYLGGIHVTDRAGLLGSGAALTAVRAVNAATDSAVRGDLVSSFITDSEGNKWFTLNADSSLARIDSRTGAVSRHPLAAVPAHILSDGSRLWAAANGATLYAVDLRGNVAGAVTLRTSDNSGDNVLAIAASPLGIIVSTTGGVWAVDPATLRARLLPLPSAQFTAVTCDTATSSLLLADDRRLMSIPLASLAPGKAVPGEKLTINGVLVDNVADASRLSTLRDKGHISIPYDVGDAVVEVATFNYTPEPTRRIAFSIDTAAMRLLPDGSNRVPLGRLPVGTHTVTVTLAGSDSAPLTFEVRVMPPWWASRPAFALYALTALGIIAAAGFAMRRRARKRINEVERRRALAAANQRLRFLSDISHDLKTPLSMIIGPVSRLREETGADTSLRRSLDTVYNAALRLNTLVHRTVELNRLETGGENMLIFSHLEAVAFCRDIVEGYKEAYPAKHFVFTASTPRAYVEADAVKLESVLNNLLSNACKYSGEEATVSTDVSVDGDRLRITVADDGLGIPADEHGVIFQRSFRSARTAGASEGTGIGLYLIKKYMELHSGTIDVESREDQGTTMTVTLPLSAEPETGAGTAPESEAAPKAEGESERGKVLIVDDNSSIAAFLCDLLGTKFTCVSACNGRAALAVAASMNPDAIVADEMMPVMSGLEMTRRLRENPRLADIPVLLVTAKDDTATQAAAIEAGVSEFVPKPFDAPLLLRRVEKAVERHREALRRRRVEALTAPTAPVEVESVTDRQLAALTRIVEEHIDDPALNVAALSELSGIHQKQLYRLVKKYVGITPVEYIRQIRLRRAAMLLAQRKFSVSEVMYMVGFSSTSYFSKCFAALYSCTPGQYAERQGNETPCL